MSVSTMNKDKLYSVCCDDCGEEDNNSFKVILGFKGETFVKNILLCEQCWEYSCVCRRCDASLGETCCRGSDAIIRLECGHCDQRIYICQQCSRSKANKASYVCPACDTCSKCGEHTKDIKSYDDNIWCIPCLKAMVADINKLLLKEETNAKASHPAPPRTDAPKAKKSKTFEFNTTFD